MFIVTLPSLKCRLHEGRGFCGILSLVLHRYLLRGRMSRRKVVGLRWMGELEAWTFQETGPQKWEPVSGSD